MSGVVKLRLQVTPIGVVSRVEVDRDTTGDALLLTCLKAYAGRWRFPPPDNGPVELTVPIELHAKLASDK